MLRRLYQLLDTRTMAGVAYGAARTFAAVTRTDMEGWLSAFERRFVRSGWPGHGTNWINLHTSRFLTRVRRLRRGAAHAAPRRDVRRDVTLRVGLIGRFVGLLGFPPELLHVCPAHVDLTLFDVPLRGQRADYLRTLVHSYRAVELDGRSNLQDAATAIAQADLDLLVNVNWKPDAHDLLDIVDTRCVANYCTGSDLMHHSRVDVELLWQLQPDNVIRDGRVWCTDTNLPVGDVFVHQVSGLYDARGLPLTPARPWGEREPLIVTHGALYKFAVPAFAECMLDILAAERDVEWILVGKDNGSALRAIGSMAAARGLSGRVHYHGEFSAVRNADGVIDDPRWDAVQELLRRARLAPDPFPIGSGSARFEAYWLGAPSPHMGIRGRGSRPIGSCDLPVLGIAAATAETVAEYRELSLRCLRDPVFAALVQQQQIAAAQRAADPVRWWQELEQAYQAWRRARIAA